MGEPKMPTPEEIKAIEESRKAYAKNNEKLASELNPDLMDIATGHNRIEDYGHYSGEKIAQSEAIEEEKTRKELERVRAEIAAQGGSDEKEKKLSELSEKLEKQQNSSLYLETKPQTIKESIDELSGKGEAPERKVLRGVIDGKKVEIKVSPKKTWREGQKPWYSTNPEESPEQFEFEGTTDGEKISSEEAMRLFKEYRNNATERKDWWSSPE